MLNWHCLAGPLVLLGAGLIPAAARGELPAGWDQMTAAQRGYYYLTEKPYVTVDFDEQTFDSLWKFWPESLRAQAEAAGPAERRRMAFQRYGLTARPGYESRPDGPLPKPLQYVVDQRGNWTMNCFACHGGQVRGEVVPGLPNSNYAMQTLTEDLLAAKLELSKPPSRNELALPFFPMGSTHGTTNAVMFGVILLSQRDADLNVKRSNGLPKLTHHDMDAPPWWHFRKRDFIYIDGFVEKGHRALMQFALIPSNGPEKFHEWEQEFRDIAAYLESIESPKYPWPVDRQLAAQGEALFNDHCAECHGTYGQREEYPGLMVEIEDLGTDPVRLQSMSGLDRKQYATSWFAHYGEKKTHDSPAGYVAPPLDGVWASAPYLHNGSVPTLWHLLHPDQRPAVWKRSYAGYDQERVGLEVESWAKLPAEVTDKQQRRTYFDTTGFGKSAAGHTFPDRLSEDEKRAVLEYLKTL